MLLAHILHNVVGKLITSRTDTLLRGNTSIRYYSHLGSTPTYIHNHIPLRRKDIHSDTNSRSHWLEKHVHITSSGMLARVVYGTYLHLGTPGRDTYHHTERGGKESMRLLIQHLDHTAYHLLGSIKICDYAVSQGTNGTDVSVCFLVHFTRFVPNGKHLIGAEIESDNRGLV